MKPFEYYDTPSISRPNKRDYTTVYFYNKGEVVFIGGYYAYLEDKENYQGCVKQEVLDDKSYKDDLEKYRKECGRLYGEFKEDLFNEFGVSDNPKREQCFELSKSSSLSETYDRFSELVELIL